MKDLKLKVGDRVECLMLGWGIVESINGSTGFCINILFENKLKQDYLSDGRIYTSSNVMLSKTGWKKPKKMKPKENDFKIGEIYYYADDKDVIRLIVKNIKNEKDVFNGICLFSKNTLYLKNETLCGLQKKEFKKL